MKTYSSILPGAVLLLAAVLFLRYATEWDSFPAFVGIYPHVVWLAGMLLGLRFNRSRLVFSVLVLAVADLALLRYVPAGSAGDDADPIVFRTVAFLLPLNLAAISLITERGFGTPRGMARLGLILSQLVLVGWSVRPEQAERASWLGRPLFEIGFTDWSPLPQPALLAFGGAFALLAVRFLLHRGAIEIGFVWATTAAFFGLYAGEGGVASTVYLSTAGFILVIAVIETSYSMAYRDELSGLPARRALNEALLQLPSRYAVAMVDVDHFKKFNDQYGHDVGDQVLRMVASRLLEVSGGGSRSAPENGPKSHRRVELRLAGERPASQETQKAQSHRQAPERSFRHRKRGCGGTRPTPYDPGPGYRSGGPGSLPGQRGRAKSGRDLTRVLPGRIRILRAIPDGLRSPVASARPGAIPCERIAATGRSSAVSRAARHFHSR